MTRFDVLRDELKKHFEKNNSQKIVSGEQFFRNYINENPPEELNDEDDFVNDNLDLFLDYLTQYEWVSVDKDSQILINKLNSQVGIKPNLTDSSIQSDDFEQINLKDTLDNNDIEQIRVALLDEDLEFEHKEELIYKAAESAEKLTSFTEDDKSEL